MSLILTITAGGVETDYTKFLDQASVQIQERINFPSQMNFNLIPYASFTVPAPRSYVKLYSTRWQRSLFTGFISAAPQPTYMGIGQATAMTQAGQVLSYGIVVASDEYLLNIKAIPFIPAYINRYQGEILSDLAEQLCPGFFDTSQIMQGDLVPFFSYTPSQAWSDIAKTFADGSRYRYKVRDKQIFYTPYGDQPLGIKYDERLGQGTFDPFKLQTTVLAVPVVNDVTIIGDTEAGNNREDYVIGDGFTGNFPLLHKVFRGSSQLLLQDSWNEASLNIQQWFQQDPGDNFNLGAGALNVITAAGIISQLGESFLMYNNALEVAGGLDAQGGEFTFNDYCDGILDGIYADQTFTSGSFIAGFVVSSPNGVTTSASGAAGVNIQPWFNSQSADPNAPNTRNLLLQAAAPTTQLDASQWNYYYALLSGVTQPGGIGPPGNPLMGVDQYLQYRQQAGLEVLLNGLVTNMAAEGNPIGQPIVSQINHSYVLSMVVTAPAYVRYNQIFRTVEGEAFGGAQNATSGSITFIVQDYDITAATGFFYTPHITQYTVNNVQLPPFVAYALINNNRLNLTVTNTVLATMPMGTLQAIVGPSGLFTPTGSILPMLPPGSGGFIGTVPVWPAAASANILAPPLLLVTGGVMPPAGTGTAPIAPTSGSPLNLVMGNQEELTFLPAAQVTQGTQADILGFFAQSLPAAGTPVRFQSFEAQAAVSRLQASGSIIEEQFVVGDDGIRAQVVSNLSPLPRTSEDCDNAALAYLADKTGIFYNGNYTIPDTPQNRIFNGLTSDLTFWPCCGRFLNVHAPQRGIVDQKYLVTGLNLTLLDMQTETIQWNIQFGADLNLDKVLKNFVDLRPPNVLTPSDTSNPPNPRYTVNVDNSFLPDLQNVQADMLQISPTGVVVNVLDPYYGNIEIRRLDTNWGKGMTPDLITVVTGPQFTLGRAQVDQVWYMRPVGFPPAVAAEIQAAAGSGTVFLNMSQWFFYYEQVTGLTVTANQAAAAGYYAGAGLSGTVNLQTFLNAVIRAGIYPGLVTSRRSKVIRVLWPQKPLAPLFVSYLQGLVQWNYNGDQRNIYGFELRTTDIFGQFGLSGAPLVLYQVPATSYANLNVDIFNATPLQVLQNFQNLSVSAYFFNQNWVYSDINNDTPGAVISVAELLPPAPVFNVGLANYGQFVVSGVALPDNIGPTTIQNLTELLIVLVYVDETTASDLFGVLVGNLSSGTDPCTIQAALTQASGNFNVGDFIVWNDSTPNPSHPQLYSYECDQIIGITGTPNASGYATLELQRQYPGEVLDFATFGSYKTNHASGTRFYKLQYQEYPQQIQTGPVNQANSSSNAGAIPDTYVLTNPVQCVVACLCALANVNGFGPFPVLNCTNVFYQPGGGVLQIPPAPGGRTLTGAAYHMTGFGAASGALLAGQRADFRARLADQTSIRTMYAYLSGPAAGNMQIQVKYIEPMQPGYTSDSQRRQGIIETLTIPAGNGSSYDPVNNPAKLRRMPYLHTWPTTDIIADDLGPTLVLQQGGDLDFVIASVAASGFTGSGLVVAVET